MNLKTLREIYTQRKTGKVSDKWSSYLSAYEKIFRDARKLPINLLEIGIQNGGSLEVWQEYFPNAKLIVGCEIKPEAGFLQYEGDIVQVIVGDANSPSAQESISKLSNSYDLIIDDGSHVSKDIIKSFSMYYPLLKPGGKYIIEDLHASYWKNWGGGLSHPLSAISFLKKLIDVMHKEHWGVSKNFSWLFDFFSLNHKASFEQFPFATIHSIEFVNSMCVIQKEDENANKLGLRMVSGDTESVSGGIKGLNSTYSPTPSQKENAWSNLKHPIEEEYLACKRRIAELEAIIEGRKEDR